MMSVWVTDPGGRAGCGGRVGRGVWRVVAEEKPRENRGEIPLFHFPTGR